MNRIINNISKMSLVFMMLIIVVVFFSSCGNKTTSKPLKEEQKVENIVFGEIKFESIMKIGIVPQVSDKNTKSYILKKEVIVSDEGTVSNIIKILSNGKHELVFTDRLPSEYILKFYFDEGKEMKAYYWIEGSQYNLTIEGVAGSITVDGKKMDNLIMKAANEIGRKRNFDPY